MPLWAAIGLFLLSIAGAALSFRAYFRGGGKIFLASGIAAALLCAAALLYCALALLLVSSID
jgi:hypothetical protein